MNASKTVTVTKQIDRIRPEGVYVKWADGIHRLVLIERVNGDCSVDEFEIARSEATLLIAQLKNLLA